MASRSLRLHQPTSRQLIERIVHSPQMAATVQALAPHTLGALIDHIGLQDCGDLISLATTKQIERIFDADLWTADRPGVEARFDGERFVLWLQVMLEVGERFAAEKLEELPEDLVVLALQRAVLVVASDVLRCATGDDDDSDLTEKALASSLYEEFDEYMVIARRHDGWDAIFAVLVALDATNRALLLRLLDRCCFLSGEYIEDNGGLYDVLTSEQMLEGDLAGEREDRLSDEGFVAPAAAAGFLNLARRTDPGAVAAAGRDPVTRAWLKQQQRIAATPRPAAAALASRAGRDLATLEALIASVTDEPPAPLAEPRLLLSAGSAGASADTDGLFRSALDALGARDMASHARRLDEIAFLGNILVSGCPLGARPFRPYEAIMATAAICNLGLERLAGAPANPADPAAAADLLAEHGADGAFRVGFSILHHDVARATLAGLAGLIDHAVTAPGRDRLRAAAAAAQKAAAPWRFIAMLDQLHHRFDDATLDTLRHLLAECPVLAGQLARVASPQRRIDGARAFISSHADVDAVRRFVASLR